MTSNVGSHIIQEDISKLNDTNREEVLEETKQKVLGVLKQSIRPEFINRVDEIVMFAPLTEKEINDIVRLQFIIIQKMLKAQNISIDITDEAVNWIGKAGFDPHYGARPVKRIIQKEILNELSKKIIANTIDKDKKIIVDKDEKGLVFSN